MKARRKDDNHNEIKAHAESLGFFVWDTYQLPKCCDCVLIKNGKVFIGEIKDGSKPPSQRKLSPDEIIFMNNVKAHGGDYRIIQSIEDVNEIYKLTL